MYKRQIVSSSQIGATLRKRRRELTLSQEVLAAKLNITNQQVQRYESGKDKISVEKLQAAAHLLSVPITYFFSNGCGDDVVPETESERELLLNFRKIQDERTKALVTDFAVKIAQLDA